MNGNDSIIQKKLVVPKVPKYFVIRRGLYNIFNNGEENIFIMNGKAGIGKTNAVAQYCHEKAGEVLWYTFDKSDNDEENFLKHFIYGISKINEQMKERLEAYKERTARLTGNFAKVLVACLLEIAENIRNEKKELYVVLDGLQYIVNHNILNMVRLLLKYLSGEMKVFILTSSYMHPCFSKYMAAGNCKKITEKDLRFSQGEIRELAEQHFEKKQIKKEYIQKVEALTDGWSVAIFCLFQYMREQEEAFEEVMKMKKRDLLMETMLYDYIYYEIYEKFSQNQQEFLKDTSVFHELDSVLCDNCLDREDSGKMLHILMRENIILVSSKKQKKCYQYFELFRLFLLEQGERGRQRNIEERAGAFYLKEQQYDKAVFYAKDNIEQMNGLLEQCGKKMLKENRLDLLGQCIQMLDKRADEFSVLEMEIAAEYFYRTNNHEQMEHYLNCADSMFGKENKYGMYRSMYRGLFHYEENTEKYEKQINNVLFFLKENQLPLPYLLETEQRILDKVMAEKETDLQKNEIKKIKVSAFGTFQVNILEDGKELSWRTKKGCELFAYLLDRDGEAVERKILLSELWKDEIPNNAVAMLHNMFYNLRKELSYYNLEYIIQYKNKKYSMDTSVIQSDLSEMVMASCYVETKNIEKLRKHEKLFLRYKGRYLEDIDNEWLSDKQEYYDKIFEKGCYILALEYMKQSEYEQALIYLKNALAVSVYSEKIVSKILKCYSKIGDLRGAKKQYEEFCGLLKKELNVMPGEEVRKSYKECMRR